MKTFLKKIPLINHVLRWAFHNWVSRREFVNSSAYWEERYKSGGNSGDGSYNHLARYKAEFINNFLASRNVSRVIEFGVGDGNQLALLEVQEYIGIDISPTAIETCEHRYAGDMSKRFQLVSEFQHSTYECALSLDVIYHLIEDDVFESYMNTLFDASEKYVIIYSSNHAQDSAKYSPHVRHRAFAEWVDMHRRDWKLLIHEPNRFPFKGDTKEGSFADFFVYQLIPPSLDKSST